jgi:hypothetical protein
MGFALGVGIGSSNAGRKLGPAVVIFLQKGLQRFQQD